MLAILKTIGLFVRANPWFAAFVVVAALSGTQTVRLKLTAGELATAKSALTAEKQARRADAEQHRREIAEAVAGHTATARAIEQAQAAVSAGVGKDVQDRLDRIGAGVDRLRRQAAEGAAAPAYLPGAAHPAGAADRAAEGDGLLRIDPAIIGECQRNTEIALGWQRWYADVTAVQPK
jgi:hypothetical protein